MTSVDEATCVAASRPLRKDAARNRELLIAAAREVFAERGLEASLDDIAHRAGLGVGTAYRHFANKHELAAAIFRQAIDDVVDLVERAAALDDPWQGLVVFLEGVAEAQTVDRGLREVLMGVHEAEQIDRVYERLTAPLRSLVERGKAARVMRDDIEVSDVGVVVTMLCAVADVTGEVATDAWRRYLPMLLAGLRPGDDLPVAALSEPEFHVAMTSHKQRLRRVGEHAPR